MIEWNVYAGEKYLGTVFANTEDEARHAALSKFDLAGDDSISVSRR